MLGLQGSATTSKVYCCMACSATFTGLRSLLVHQASHVNVLDQDKHLHSSKPSSSAQIGSMEQLNQKHCTTPTPEAPACSNFICDCGCEFKDFHLMMEHKKTHMSKTEMPPGEATSTVCADGDCCEPPLLQPILNQSTFNRPISSSMPSSSIMSSSNIPTTVSGFPTPEVDSGRFVLLTVPPEDTSPPDPAEQGQSLSFEEPSSQAMQSPVEVNHSVTRKNNYLPKEKSIMKMLATAYMKRFQTLQPSVTHCKRHVIPKTETIPVEITSTLKSKPSETPSSSVDQLRRLLLKSSTKTKASVFRNSCSEDIVVVTKSYCPVVVLETRQKLIDLSNMSAQGNYQCGRCRRVFKDCDSLTLHHATHRKEKVKCCRLCKQLIIGKPSLPDNHTCPMLRDKALFQSAKSKLPFIKRTSSFHHQKTYYFKQQRAFVQSNTRKPFYCQFCNHSYTRRYSLKTHKCLGPQFSHHASVPTMAEGAALGTNKESETSHITERPQSPSSVGVGTDAFQYVKGENISAEVESAAQLSDLPWSGCPRSFSPFSPKHPTKNIASVEMGASVDDWVADQFKMDQRPGSDDAEAGCSRQAEDGQWTSPLDDETEVLIDAEDGDDSDADQQESMPSDMSLSPKNRMPFFIKDGVKRYPCNNCLKTYSRGTTLRKHQKICGSLRSYGLQGAFGSAYQKGKGKPMHDCFVCGKSFNRRDNMMAHRRKCQLRRTVGGMHNRQQNLSASESLSLLGAKSEGSDLNQVDNGSNWGIMSLPCVLPRRVTCECGASFTSPQLLLEHLQKHAQESYTCPTCGETLSSWADYEVHLQVHMQPNNHLYHGVPLQRSQPLLLRFQQHPHQRPGKQPAPKKQTFSEPYKSVQHPGTQPSLIKSKQPCVCIRCNNTFSTRSSLIKHLSLNRCKGIQGSLTGRTNHCSRCNEDFPNVVSLKFHLRSGGCKTAFKPMRCPVCVRWFGTVEGLQKHLLTHNQSDSFSCLLCQRVYSSLKSLKDHSRKVHKIRAGDIVPVTRVTI